LVKILTTEKNEEKILCAVKNPSDRGNQSWFYNKFLGRDRKYKKEERKEIKVNWLMLLTSKEIDELKESTCKVIKLADNVEIDTEEDVIESYKNGFNVLYNLFVKTMQEEKFRNKLVELLSNEDGSPGEDYHTIMKTKEMMEEEETNA